MKYFRVPVKMDGKRVVKRGPIYSEFTRELIREELYTPREIERFGMSYLKDKLEEVEISRKRIFFSFGARFAV